MRDKRSGFIFAQATFDECRQRILVKMSARLLPCRRAERAALQSLINQAAESFCFFVDLGSGHVWFHSLLKAGRRSSLFFANIFRRKIYQMLPDIFRREVFGRHLDTHLNLFRLETFFIF